MADDKVGQTASVTIMLMTFITLTVVMRTCVRSVLLRSVGWDDTLVIISWVLAMALCGAILAMTNVGLGSHFQDVSKSDFAEFLRLQVVTQLTYIWAFVTVKMSFTVLYLRLLPDQMYQRINKFLLILLLAEGIEETAVVIFRCNPIPRAWTPSIPGTCLDLTIFYYSAFAIKLMTDLVLFVQPIPTIWKLQLPMAKRCGVIFMLSLGLLVCIISVIRVSYINAFDKDVTFLVADPLLWSEVEVCALIICSGVPSLRPLISRFPALNKALGLSTGKFSKNYYANQRTTIGGSKPYLAQNAYARGAAKQGFGKLSQSSSSYGTGSGTRTNTESMENILPLDLDKPSLTHSVEMGIIKVKNDIHQEVRPASPDVMDPYFPAGRPMARRKSRGNIHNGTGWISDD
ncbi:Satratoxin biosynthesis SC1 cluster protein 4 [Colletotrichum tropicale]|nr:Satratoxin biosynthesis SC1 cluster protein 4 [Colletotrichum tropicale]